MVVSPNIAKWLRCASMVACCLTTVAGVRAASPLHGRIDHLVERHASFDPAAAVNSTDAEFLRRVTLDLTGTIPSPTVVREFLRDPSADKRTRVVDALLASPEHVRRMQYVFDAMLMERGPDVHVPAKEWRAYLRRSFAENRPWNELAFEILSADGTEEASRPAAKFLLDRKLEADQVTRDLGRIFLGRDLQCAQCHDHPNVDDYRQRHYYGLNAFLSRSYLYKDAKTGVTSIGEKAEGDVEFTSVFTDESDETAPRMLDLPPVPDPVVEGEPYTVKPAKNARGVPVYSRRLRLAEAMTDDTNTAFRRNIVNRMWKLMMGRGLVEPVDMWHADNPPTHPELLDLLADDLRDHGYDLRYLLRELALSQTYQRSSRGAAAVEKADRMDGSTARLKPLTPEQLAWSMMQATGVVADTRSRLESEQAKKPKKDAPKTVEAALEGEVRAFVSVFGAVGPGVDDFDAAAEQALFLRNGKSIQSWIALDGGLSARLVELDDADVAEELYLAVYSRRPTAEEARDIVQYLGSADPRDEAVRRLVWATLVSAEFRFNH